MYGTVYMYVIHIHLIQYHKMYVIHIHLIQYHKMYIIHIHVHLIQYHKMYIIHIHVHLIQYHKMYIIHIHLIQYHQVNAHIHVQYTLTHTCKNTHTYICIHIHVPTFAQYRGWMDIHTHTCTHIRTIQRLDGYTYAVASTIRLSFLTNRFQMHC